MTASVGSFSDKLKILKLNVKLKGRSLETIFAAEERSTREYLQAEGFSERIISNFFKPFFAGIFLEPDLKTSSRMFEFVYKLFGEGMAVLPKAGISAITEQLKSQLNDTQFKFNTKVSAVNDEHILLDNNQKLETHFTIIATEASSLLSNLNTKTQWKSCDNLYFTVKSKTIQKPIIGLVADADALINNLFYCNSVATKSKGAQELLSVTVVKKHELDEKDLIAKVQQDLKQFCDIEHSTFLKRYQILQALPDLEHLQYDCSPTETRIKPTIFLAGDQMLNGSLNAAMIAGERAAQGVILALEDGLRADGITSEYR
jgi:protoporphyrinogen oxidase